MQRPSNSSGHASQAVQLFREREIELMPLHDGQEALAGLLSRQDPAAILMMRALANDFQIMWASKRPQDLYCHTPGFCNCEPQSGGDLDLGTGSGGFRVTVKNVFIKMIAARACHVRLCYIADNAEWRVVSLPKSLVSAPPTALKRAGLR